MMDARAFLKGFVKSKLIAQIAREAHYRATSADGRVDREKIVASQIGFRLVIKTRDHSLVKILFSTALFCWFCSACDFRTSD
jgi:hypothetical protein